MAGLNAGGELRLEDRLHRSKGRAARSSIASARVTQAELWELDHAAEAEGKALSEWAREALLAAARRPKGDPVFTEVLAGRVVMLELLRPLLHKAGVDEEAIHAILVGVRRDKHTTAREVMKQYAPPEGQSERAPG